MEYWLSFESVYPINHDPNLLFIIVKTKERSLLHCNTYIQWMNTNKIKNLILNLKKVSSYLII